MRAWTRSGLNAIALSVLIVVPTSIASQLPVAAALTPAISNGPIASVTPVATCQRTTLAINFYDFHATVLKTDGSVWGWGDNFGGVLGSGTPDDRNGHPTPIQVLGVGGTGTLNGIGSISAGLGNVFAVRSNATVAAWGSPYLGNGSSSGSTTPVLMQGPGGAGLLLGANQATSGNDIGVAVKGDGYTWGNALLGDGTSNSSPSPVHVVGPNGTGFLNGVVQLAIGTNVVFLALRSDGTVWSWGYGSRADYGSIVLYRNLLSG